MKKNNHKLNYFEKWFNLLGYQKIAGIDEAGRGAWAGPIVVAICILPKNYFNLEINDSKKINSNKRKLLYKEICQKALDYHIEVIDAKTVDLINPKQASITGMEKCLEKITLKPEISLVDAEKLNSKYYHYSIIKGDEKSISIAAASILAKVYRDNLMKELDKKYPSYFFNKNKGYGTQKHLLALKKNSPIKNVHRFSYKPIKDLNKKQLSFK